MRKMKGLKHGVYKIFWIGGGSSLASIGYTHDGTNWFAPCNWTSKDNNKPMVASTKWQMIDRIEFIEENSYEKSNLSKR